MPGQEGGAGLGGRAQAERDLGHAVEARRAEETVGLRRREAGEVHRLEPGGDAVGALDLRLDRLRQLRRQAEADVDRRARAARRARRSRGRPRAFTGEIMSPMTYSGASCSSAASRQRGSARGARRA